MSDQDRISPYNINTISTRQVVRIFVLDIFSIGQTKKFTTICIPTDWNFPIFENSTLFSRTKRKERKDVLKLWEISWPQNISLEILHRTACVSLNCVPLSTAFIVINEACVYILTFTLISRLQQESAKVKQTCRVTMPSAFVGWVPFNHPLAWAPHLCLGTHDEDIFDPASPRKRNQAGPRSLSQRRGCTSLVSRLSPLVKAW